MCISVSKAVSLVPPSYHWLHPRGLEASKARFSIDQASARLPRASNLLLIALRIKDSCLLARKSLADTRRFCLSIRSAIDVTTGTQSKKECSFSVASKSRRSSTAFTCSVTFSELSTEPSFNSRASLDEAFGISLERFTNSELTLWRSILAVVSPRLRPRIQLIRVDDRASRWTQLKMS